MPDQERTKIAIVRLPHEGTRHEFSRAPGSSRRIVIGGDQTSGALALSDLTAPGVFGGPPEHIHHHFEEMFYVLEGTLELLIAHETVSASAGTFVIIPRDVMHKPFKVNSEPARWLEFFVPAGFEQFFEQLATGLAEGRAAYDTLFSELAGQHDVEFIQWISDGDSKKPDGSRVDRSSRTAQPSAFAPRTRPSDCRCPGQHCSISRGPRGRR